MHATRYGLNFKHSFSLYPPLFGELVLSDRKGVTQTSKMPTILRRPDPDDDDIVADCLIAGIYVLRCDFDGIVDLRLDLDICDWYSID